MTTLLFLYSYSTNKFNSNFSERKLFIYNIANSAILVSFSCLAQACSKQISRLGPLNHHRFHKGLERWCNNAIIVEQVMWCQQLSVNHQGLLCNLRCAATVVLREQLNFKSAVLRSKRSSCCE